MVRGDEGVGHPAFKPGRVLVSSFYLNAIALVDMEQGAVVWGMKGPFRHQHEAGLTDTGTLLLFDNEGLGRASRALEFQPGVDAPVWQYPSPGERSLYSATCSTAYRLPNGNTLLTESDRGRALEVSSYGATVWVFFSPHRAGDEKQLVATLFDMRRIDTNRVRNWLELPTGWGDHDDPDRRVGASHGW